jgi:hypothetical protein
LTWFKVIVLSIARSVAWASGICCEESLIETD